MREAKAKHQPVTATITLTERGPKRVDITIEFDPPIDGESDENRSPVYSLLMRMLDPVKEGLSGGGVEIIQKEKDPE